MNNITVFTQKDKNDLCAILSRNGYVATAYNIVSMTENTCCGKQWRIDYYDPKDVIANAYSEDNVITSISNQGELNEMSDEEHLIENLICYVQSVGWANVPEQFVEDNEPFYDLYERYGKNGLTQVTIGTFKWLLDMAVYVVYHATNGTDFSEEEK